MRLGHLDKIVCLLLVPLLVLAFPAKAQEPRHRVIVLTDIGNEPDDSESFVRFLLYANQFDVEGLVATTSTWQRGKTQPQLLRERVEAYAKVLPNLREHASGYPDAASLAQVIRAGSASYGMQGVGQGKDTDGSRLIVAAVDRPDPRPVYVPVWGGAVDLAQALWTVRATRSPEQVAAFVAKLRVYSISDQDDTGAWARRNFPDLFWIASVHGWSQYGMAAWIGISGDVRRPDKWPAAETVTNEWLDRHIRRGPLGALYPPHLYIMEGDTPSFLWLIGNGLNLPEHPEYGGWGGRYLPAYEGAGHRADAQDSYVDADGRRWSGNQATIYRWRQSFQNDFAARIGWTLTPERGGANHNPALVLNGVAGTAPVTITVRSGAVVKLDATGSSDPDGDRLSYRWWLYAEASTVFTPSGQGLEPLTIAGADRIATEITAPAVKARTQYNIVLEVSDSGAPALTSYRRALLTVTP